jgi:single-strand DNA-binding protein
MAGFTINRVFLSGNLTRDPEMRSIPSTGTALCKMRLAVNDRYKDNASGEWMDRPNYFDVTIWKGMAEWCGSNLHKGDQVAIEGKLRWHEWDDNGQKRQAVDVTAESIVPVRTRENGGSSSGGYSHTDSDIPADDSDLPTAGTAASSEPLPDTDDIPF